MGSKTERRRRGDVGESIAAEFLQRKGYTIIERNYLKPWGEIDIIGLKDGVVRFVEVKTVTRESSAPEELIDMRKLRKIARTAALYMEGKGDTRDYQIDAVGVIMDELAQRARCRLYEQALEE